jgi:hypothetical protein
VKATTVATWRTVALTDWLSAASTDCFCPFSPSHVAVAAVAACRPPFPCRCHPLLVLSPFRPMPAAPPAIAHACPRFPPLPGNGKAARRVSTVASHRWLAWSYLSVRAVVGDARFGGGPSGAFAHACSVSGKERGPGCLPLDGTIVRSRPCFNRSSRAVVLTPWLGRVCVISTHVLGQAPAES